MNGLFNVAFSLSEKIIWERSSFSLSLRTSCVRTVVEKMRGSLRWEDCLKVVFIKPKRLCKPLISLNMCTCMQTLYLDRLLHTFHIHTYKCICLNIYSPTFLQKNQCFLTCTSKRTPFYAISDLMLNIVKNFCINLSGANLHKIKTFGIQKKHIEKLMFTPLLFSVLAHCAHCTMTSVSWIPDNTQLKL